MNFEVGAKNKDEKIQALSEMVKFFSWRPENFLTRRTLEILTLCFSEILKEQCIYSFKTTEV